MAASAALLKATISFSPSQYHPLQRSSLPSSFKPYLSSPSMPTHHPTFQPQPPRLPPFLPHRLIIPIFPDDMYDETQKGFGRRRCTAGERFELACNGTRSVVYGHAGHAGAGGGGSTFKTDSSTSSSSSSSQPSYSSSTSSSRPSYYSSSSSSILTHHPTFQPQPPLLPPFPPHRLIIPIFPDDMYDETQKGFDRRRCTAGERLGLACNGTRSVVHGHAGHAGAGGGGRTFKTDSSTSSSSSSSQPSYSSSTLSSRPSYYSSSSSSIYSRPSDSSHSSSDSRSSSPSSNYSSTRLATLEELCMAMQAMQAPVVAAGPSSPIPPLRLLRRRPSLATLLLLHHLGPATIPLRCRFSTLALQIPPTRLATLDHLPLRLTTHPTRRRPRPTTLTLNRRGLPPPSLHPP